MHFLERRQGAKSAKFAKGVFVGSVWRTALAEAIVNRDERATLLLELVTS
jgi:hypothetical protein